MLATLFFFCWRFIFFSLSLHFPDLTFKELWTRLFFTTRLPTILTATTQQAEGLKKSVPAEQTHSHQVLVLQRGFCVVLASSLHQIKQITHYLLEEEEHNFQTFQIEV